MKILIIYGTRPEAIKMAPIINLLRSKIEFDTKVCITGQHREMLDQVNDFFEIEPDYSLNLMRPNQNLNELASNLFRSIDDVLSNLMPDWVLIHGDTTTSAIAAWASFHRKIKIGHVEAGLRTFDKMSPFPEEINRQITGRIADIHFAPTPLSEANLLEEKIDRKNILVTGNTVIDALQLGLKKIHEGYICSDLQLIKSLINPLKKLIVITGHRRENFGDGFESLCSAIKVIAENEDVQIIYPVHLNPNVQEPVNRILSNIPNIHLIQPIDYPAFIYLMSQSYLLITDSGGVQEEAPSLGKPVIVIRDNTERPEAVSAGTVLLVGTDQVKIVNACVQLLNDHKLYSRMSLAHNPYGDGLASKKIVEFIGK